MAFSPKIGLEEAEWRDGPEARADWEAWIRTIEPLELTPEERVERACFREEMRRFKRWTVSVRHPRLTFETR